MSQAKSTPQAHARTLPGSPDDRTLTAARLADKLRAEIEGGAYQPGGRFPSMRTLAQRTEAAYSTVIRAVDILQAEGLVEKSVGSKGTFVTYRPGATEGATETAARQTANKRIGVILPFWASSLSHYVVGDILRGVSSQAATDDHRVELIHNVGEEATAFNFVDKVVSLELDGVVWIQPHPAHEMNLGRLLDRGVKVVATGRRFKSLPLAVIHEDVGRTGKLVADYMAEHNRKELVVLSGPLADMYSADRIEAVRDALKPHGLQLPDENICIAHAIAMDQNLPGQRALDAAVNHFLVEHEGFDTVFALHPNHLAPLVRLHDSGRRRCPNDFALIHLAPACEPVRQQFPQIPITLIQWPLFEVGRAAVLKLQEMWGEASEADTPDLSPILDIAEQSVSGAGTEIEGE